MAGRRLKEVRQYGNSFKISAEADPLDRDKEFYKKPPNGDNDGISISVQDFSFPIYKYKTEINKFVSICDNYIDKKIGIVSQCSVDRINRLKAMSERWNGIISVSIYIKNLNELFIVQNIFEKDLKNKTNICIHLIYANNVSEYYPINYLRNIALNNCKCEYVFLLDIDFITNYNLYNQILNNLPKVKELLVIPAFEIVNEYKTKCKYHPKNKKDLIKKYLKGNIKQFHLDFINGHKLTNYKKWIKYNDNDNEYNNCYNIQYDIQNTKNWLYEPYVVVKNDKYLAKYDERFTGYGLNKIIHIVNLAIKQKYEFKVLKNGFVTCSKHAPSNDKYNTYKSKKLSNQRLKWLQTLFSLAINNITCSDV